jgi:ribosomal protein S19E (S16A)
MGFSGGGAASGAMSGASMGMVAGPWGAAAGAVVGGAAGGLSGGAADDAAKTAANNSRHLADLEANKYQLNAVLAQYEANRIQDVTNLDIQYLGFATERQAKWLAMSASLDREIALGSVADKYLKGADEASARAADINAMGEIQADNTERSGARKAATLTAQTNLKRVMQQEEDAKKLGLVRASAGARMVAYSGSALDVLAHEEAMANARQVSITVLGGMQADDVQYDAKLTANAIRQKASIQAQGELRQYVDNPLDNPVLQAQLVKADIGTERDIALTKEQGWREGMKMKMDAATAMNKAILGMGDQQIRAASSQGLASAYGAQADAGTDMYKTGSTLLTGATSIFKEAKQGGWFTTSPSTPGTSTLGSSYINTAGTDMTGGSFRAMS